MNLIILHNYISMLSKYQLTSIICILLTIMLYNYVQTDDKYEPSKEELNDREKLDKHVLKMMKKEQITINDKMTKSCRSGLIRGALTGCITGGLVGGVAGGALFGVVNPLMIYLGED
jgi:hypothetical protein